MSENQKQKCATRKRGAENGLSMACKLMGGASAGLCRAQQAALSGVIRKEQRATITKNETRMLGNSVRQHAAAGVSERGTKP